MKTVDKAMHVLDQFTTDRTEIGLSDLARLSGLDKAATRRLLLALGSHGYIEQVAETRKYRLGQGFLRLARIREATVPMSRAAQEVADWLVEQTGETVHISVPTPTSMTTIAHRLPPRGNVINIIPGEALYYHATAAGLAFMSYATEQTRSRLLALRREQVASGTKTKRADLLAAIEQTRKDGFSQSRNSFEDGVSSISMPFFSGPGDPAGTISVALPSEHMTPERRTDLLPLLKAAIERIETALRG